MVGSPDLGPSHWPLPRPGASPWPPQWAPQGRRCQQRPAVALPVLLHGCRAAPSPWPPEALPKGPTHTHAPTRRSHRPPSTGPLPRKSRPGSGQDVACSQKGPSWQVGRPCPQAAIHQGHTRRLCPGKREPQSTFSWLGAMNLALSWHLGLVLLRSGFRFTRNRGVLHRGVLAAIAVHAAALIESQLQGLRLPLGRQVRGLGAVQLPLLGQRAALQTGRRRPGPGATRSVHLGLPALALRPSAPRTRGPWQAAGWETSRPPPT